MANLVLGKLPLEKGVWNNPEQATNGNHIKYDDKQGFAWAKIPATYTLDLESAIGISQIRILLYDGPEKKYLLNDREYSFEVSVSQHGKSFHKVLDGRSEGRGKGWFVIDLAGDPIVQFIQVRGISNTANNQFHIVEIEVYDIAPKLLPQSQNLKRFIFDYSKPISDVRIEEAKGNKQDHFYTSPQIRQFEKLGTYKKIGVVYHVFEKQLKGTVPLARYFNKNSFDHFYCINSEEEKLSPDWIKEMDLGFVYPPVDSNTISSDNVVPLNRYYNPELKDHFYTIETDRKRFEAQGYKYEKVECRVLDKPNKATIPVELWVRGSSLMSESIEDEEVIYIPDADISRGEYQMHFDANVPPAMGVLALAEDIAVLLSNITSEKGNMVGIFGEWGRGKSYLISQITQQQIVRDSFIAIEYHAWKYQDTPASWAYLYEEFAKKYLETNTKSKFQQKCVEVCRTTCLNVSIHGWYPLVFMFLGILIFFGGLLLERPTELVLEVLWWLTLGASSTVIAASIATYVRFKKTATDLFSKYLKRPRFNEFMGAQAEIQKELSSLLKHWMKLTSEQEEEKGIPSYKRILLVIEDIDRCSEDKIIRLVDSLRVMLDDPIISKRVVVLAAIDERILKSAISLKYHDILSKDFEQHNMSSGDWKFDLYKNSTRTIREYMDKLFMAGVKLGSLGQEYRLDYFDNLLKNTRVSGVDASTLSGIENTEEVIESNNQSGLDDSQSGVEKNVESDVARKAEESYDITFQEKVFLEECIGGFHGATPRQIRIFYYRYLLGRTLLKRKNVFEINHLAMFATLLVQSNEEIVKHKEHSASLDDAIEGVVKEEIWECLEMVRTY